MKPVYKFLAYMGCQYQTVYIKAGGVAVAIDAILRRGAVQCDYLGECAQGHSFDIEI